MGYIDRAKENAKVAAKAAAFDKMEQQQREQDMYARGANDISAEVDRQLRTFYQSKNPSMGYNQLPADQLGLAQQLTGL